MAAIQLISGPERTSGMLSSRWNAAFNPVTFTYQRKDFEVTGISQDDTTFKPIITVDGDTTGLKVDDLVYLDAGITNDISTFKGAYKVLTIVGANNFSIDADYLAPDSVTGYCNINRLRPYYKVVTKIKYVDVSTGRFGVILSTNRPGLDGVTKADISNFLQSILNPYGPDKSDYTEINFRDYDLAASYQTSYSEFWEGYSGAFTDYSDPYYVVYSAAQLGQKWGGNLLDYTTQAGQLAKFLSDFNEPSYTAGFPFDLGFIYSELIAGKQVSYKIVLLDINRNPTGDADYNAFLLNENSSFLLNEDNSKFLILRQQLITGNISERIGLNRLLINQNFGPNVYYFTTQLFVDSNLSPASFEGILAEATDPVFIDCQLQIAFNSEIPPGGDMYASGTVEFAPAAGTEYHIFGGPQGANAGGSQRVIMQIKKDGVLIYQKAIASTLPGGMTKTGIIQPGAAYQSKVFSEDTGTVYADIDIADDEPVTSDPQAITEVKTTRIDNNLKQNIIYLRWIGLTGSWNYFRFNFSQDITLDVQNSVIIKQFVNDWENQQGIEEVISKNAGQKIQVYADALDNNDIDGLRSIKFSPKVQMLVSKNPVKWQTIVVNLSTFQERNTQQNQNEFSITFNLPSINIQTQ